jgi:hypothetical protein
VTDCCVTIPHCSAGTDRLKTACVVSDTKRGPVTSEVTRYIGAAPSITQWPGAGAPAALHSRSTT